MPEVSIILPSLRREAVLQRVQEFSLTNQRVDYEIIVVSPFAVKEDRVVDIYEDRPQGTIHAHNVAYKNSSGAYIVPWADDAVPTKNCIANILNFVKSHNDPFIASFRLKNRYGQELDQWSVYGKLYAGLSCVSRKTIGLVGGYYDGVYRGYWADPDMSLRVWQSGGKVEICPNAWAIMEHIVDKVREGNWSKYFDNDFDTFLNRWHGEFGRKLDRAKTQGNWTLINKPVCSTTKKVRRALISQLANVPYLRKIKQRLTKRLS
jgi:GT2 family glycosyltransferase